jgi:hypothetical protein
VGGNEFGACITRRWARRRIIKDLARYGRTLRPAVPSDFSADQGFLTNSFFPRSGQALLHFPLGSWERQSCSKDTTELVGTTHGAYTWRTRHAVSMGGLWLSPASLGSGATLSVTSLIAPGQSPWRECNLNLESCAVRGRVSKKLLAIKEHGLSPWCPQKILTRILHAPQTRGQLKWTTFHRKPLHDPNESCGGMKSKRLQRCVLQNGQVINRCQGYGNRLCSEKVADPFMNYQRFDITFTFLVNGNQVLGCRPAVMKCDKVKGERMFVVGMLVVLACFAAISFLMCHQSTHHV